MAFGIDLDLSTPGANYKIKRCVVTLASGEGEAVHGFTKVLAVLPVLTAASSAIDEPITWVATLNTDKIEVPAAGKSTIKSSNASSTAVIVVIVIGQ